MTTLEEYDKACNEANDLLKWINNICENLMTGELCLADIVAEEESLDNRCYELNELMKKIISLRQLLDFESIGYGGPF